MYLHSAVEVEFFPYYAHPGVHFIPVKVGSLIVPPAAARYHREPLASVKNPYVVKTDHLTCNDESGQSKGDYNSGSVDGGGGGVVDDQGLMQENKW